MTDLSLSLVSENEHPDGFYYRARVEAGVVGLCRLNVQCCKQGEDEAEASQGMDLSAAECRALAQMLLAAAAVLDASLG